MPKIICKCGNWLRYSDIPNRIEWCIISDVEYDDYHGMIDSEKLYEQMRSMLLCDQCGRLWVYWNGFQNMPTLYHKEAVEEPKADALSTGL